MDDFINTIDLIGDDAVMDGIINRTITEFKDDIITNVANYAFNACTNLVEVDLPNVTKIGGYVFQGCTALTKVYIPQITTLGGQDFDGCPITDIYMPNLTSLSTYSFRGAKFTHITEELFPKVTHIGSAFSGCRDIVVVDLPKVTQFRGYVFSNADNLTKIILRNTETMCALTDTSAFGWGNAAIWKGTGYVYVPRTLIEDYKVATNWSTFANQFRALEDYTVDGTVTGELDESKI